MAWYLANRDEVLDQFATGGGLVELRAAVDGYPALKTFIDEGITKNVHMCKLQLEKLAKRTENADVKDTAEGLAKLMNGQEFVAITQGFGFAPEHDTEKEDASTQHTESLRESQREIPALQVFRDKQLARAFRRIEKLARARFRAQVKAVLQSHALHALQPREADSRTKDSDRRAVIADAVAAVVLHQPVTAADSALYDTAIRQAIDTGDAAISDLLASTPASTESFIAEYLKDAGFSQLTGDIDKTTVDRIAGAIADAYDAGKDFDGVVSAVKSEFREFTATRARMIAQTELNDAFNESIAHFGREAGATMKSWQTEPGACIICIENQLAGNIDINADFPSGHDQPTAHPLCGCSLMVHVV